MKMTERVASLSYDSKYQVGSIIINKEFSKIAAMGYNGNYPGGPNERDSMESGHSGFLHAEENAIIEATMTDPENHILFVTMTPCKMCAKRIARKNIKEVIALSVYNSNEHEEIFRNSGVKFNYLIDKVKDLFINTIFFDDLITMKRDIISSEISIEDKKFRLEKLLFNQLEVFFEYKKEKISKIPFDKIVFDLSDLENSYINTFYNIVYEII
jgi:dCMP deaminase